MNHIAYLIAYLHCKLLTLQLVLQGHVIQTGITESSKYVGLMH